MRVISPHLLNNHKTVRKYSEVQHLNHIKGTSVETICQTSSSPSSENETWQLAPYARTHTLDLQDVNIGSQIVQDFEIHGQAPDL